MAGGVCKEEEGVASDGSKGGKSLDAVTPGLTLGTLYSSGVGINKTKQHYLQDLLSTHPCAPLTSLPTFFLTTSPSPAPLTSVRWPDSNVQAAAGSVP